jgi:short subunit dehydrogenase-like uncharacterized protein
LAVEGERWGLEASLSGPPAGGLFKGSAATGINGMAANGRQREQGADRECCRETRNTDHPAEQRSRDRAGQMLAGVLRTQGTTAPERSGDLSDRSER